MKSELQMGKIHSRTRDGGNLKTDNEDTRKRIIETEQQERRWHGSLWCSIDGEISGWFPWTIHYGQLTNPSKTT